MIRPWLYAIARNECISMIRRRRERELQVSESAEAEEAVGRDAELVAA